MAQNRVRELRTARGLTVVSLAEKVGISHSYLTRIENGKRGLSVELAEAIAMALDSEADEVLGLKGRKLHDQGALSKPPGFADDVEPYVWQPGELKLPKLGDNEVPWRIKTDCIDQAGYTIGDVVIVDISAEHVENLKPLQCVVAQLFHPDNQILQSVTILRQFVPPNLLIVNSSKRVELPLRLDTEEVGVRGVIVGSIRSARG